MHDVNSISPPHLSWFPPEEWLDGRGSLVGESAADIDVGAIRLKPATTVRVAVELVGGSPLSAGNREGEVILRSKEEFPARLLARLIGSERVIDRIYFEEGIWQVRLFGRKVEEYRAPFHAQLGRRDQKFTLRLLRDTLTPGGDYGLRGGMEISESR